MTTRSLLLAAFTCTAMLGLAACEKKGPLEQAGEEVDEAIDTMKVLKEHGSDEFAQTLDEGIRTAQTHLDHAKQLMKQLEGAAASTARRQTEDK